MVNKCYNLTTPEIPIEVYKDFTSFKLYMGDTGLLTMGSGTPHEMILNLSGSDNRFLGAIAENYVAQSKRIRKEIRAFILDQDIR